MKNTLIILAVVSMLGLYACECNKVDCRGTDNVFLYFLSKTDSTDLINSSQYELNSLKITTIFEGSTGSQPRILIASDYPGSYTAAVPASRNVAGYIIQLDSLPPDTLLTTVGVSTGSKCCSGVTFFEQLILNGDTLANSPINYFLNIYK
ncbi:MAG: hypothetical protein K9J37_02315 [Saprospiraceae bacterium]|nr:hypothetical protein [Saprospiraceae bacterium]MCF8248714.1 hypothetical protein [Saprospiraceae bacterium]MCF8278796.1 hypothetical protein [Bacteroidales bacterium]MCF8310596.1 hypothetical protein [Saprospiraceae bacterium]MCF8439155.1 hypothetical protein [Saprospiraceae bacterium]